MADLTLTVPAEHLDAMRNALVAEVVSDAEMLAQNHQAAIARGLAVDEDRAGAIRFMRHDVAMLAQITDATTDTLLVGSAENLSSILDGMVRTLRTELEDIAGFVPVDMSRVLDLTAKLKWAAENAIRLDRGDDARRAA